MTMAAAKTEKLSKMQKTSALGTDFWNDSCAIGELSEAVDNGAVGATSNPVIVCAVVDGDRRRWIPVLDSLVRGNPEADEDQLAWKLIAAVGVQAAKLLKPVYDRTAGKKGYLSIQVSPKYYRDAKRMTAHAKELAALAPNVAIKLPCTEAGLRAMEETTAAGINVNATVSFTVAQACAAAQACERGMARAEKSGADMSRLHPYTTIMVGRVDDHLKRVLKAEKVSIDPGRLEWAGIAVFKRARREFVQKGYRSTLLAAAYRHVMHWTELIGGSVILTIPYPWWKQFEASDVKPEKRLDVPVDPEIVSELKRLFPEFVRAYEPEGLKPSEFAAYGASADTLSQFLGGYAKLLETVRERMIAAR